MNRNIMLIITFILWWTISAGCTGAQAQQQQEVSAPQQPSVEQTASELDIVLEKLNKSALDLVSYECGIEYTYIQPVLFDDQSLRKGQLYYLKQDNKTNFRLNFLTLKQNEMDEEKYIEQFIVVDGNSISDVKNQFTGTWLVYIDYQTEELKYYQCEEPEDSNQSSDIFELIGRYMPIVGFTHANELKEQFEVSLAPPGSEPEDFIQVHLDVKPNSVYKDKYTYIDFWIDEKMYLPVKIVAVTPQEDIVKIELKNPKVNEKIAADIFKFEPPKNIEPEIFPLKENTDKDI